MESRKTQIKRKYLDYYDGLWDGTEVNLSLSEFRKMLGEDTVILQPFDSSLAGKIRGGSKITHLHQNMNTMDGRMELIQVIKMTEDYVVTSMVWSLPKKWDLGEICLFCDDKILVLFRPTLVEISVWKGFALTKIIVEDVDYKGILERPKFCLN